MVPAVPAAPVVPTTVDEGFEALLSEGTEPTPAAQPNEPADPAKLAEELAGAHMIPAGEPLDTPDVATIREVLEWLDAQNIANHNSRKRVIRSWCRFGDAATQTLDIFNRKLPDVLVSIQALENGNG